MSESDEIVVKSARLRRPGRLRALSSLLSCLLLVPCLGVAIAGWLTAEEYSRLLTVVGLTYLGAFLVVPGGLLLAFLFFTWSSRRWRSSRAHLRDEGLHLGETLFPREELALAWRPHTRIVEVITTNGSELRLQTESAEDAITLARTVNDGRNREHTYLLLSQSAGWNFMRKVLGWVVPLGSTTLVAGVFSPAYALLLLPAGLLSFWAARGERAVRFGADALVIEGRFRKRCVPYRTIAEVTKSDMFDRTVQLVLTDGTVVLVGTLLDDARARLLHALIQEGVDMVVQGNEAGSRVAALERGSASDAPRAERLDSVAERSDYRTPAADLERIVSLLRNPAADPDQRIAAAFALRRSPSGKAKIRVAADVSVERDVRDALEALAEGDLDEARARQLLARL